jgi:hypothetical protein
VPALRKTAKNESPCRVDLDAAAVLEGTPEQLVVEREDASP